MVAPNNTRNMTNVTNNRLEKYFVITPAVSIDRSHQTVSRNKSNFTTTTTTTATDSNASWQWCSLWCSAIKCFNANTDGPAQQASPIGTQVYQQNDNHFIRIDLPRKYRDKNCNVTYEL